MQTIDDCPEPARATTDPVDAAAWSARDSAGIAYGVGVGVGIALAAAWRYAGAEQGALSRTLLGAAVAILLAGLLTVPAIVRRRAWERQQAEKNISAAGDPKPENARKPQQNREIRH